MNMSKHTSKATKTLEKAVAEYIEHFGKLAEAREKAPYSRGTVSLNELYPSVAKLEVALKHHRGEDDDVPRQKYENIPDREYREFGYTERHESYGIVQISRVSGHRALFASAVKHQHYFEMRVLRGQRRMTESGEYFRHDDAIPIVTIGMSASQFVDMITTQNMGEGVPCTITSIDGIRMESPPAQQTELAAIHSLFEERVEDVKRSLDVQVQEVDSILDKKNLTKEDRGKVREAVRTAARVFYDHAPFVLGVFSEHTEKMVSKGKAEVESFINLALHRAGVKSVKDSNGRLILGSGDGEGER
jgi:hypothetical protein